MISAECELTVEFNDADPMGVVWNGRYFDYFEIARHAVLARAGVEYADMYREGYMLPLVKNSAKYIKPLMPGDRAIVSAVVTEYELMLKMSFTIRKAGTGEITTKGESTQFAVNTKGESLGCLPESLVERLRSLDV